MPLLESIAIVPPRRGRPNAKSSHTVSGGTSDTLPMQAALARNSYWPGVQRLHRYAVGERLRVASGGYSMMRSAGTCKVLAVLPDEGRGPLLYRVRNDNESFERIVAEGDLAAGESSHE